MYKRQKLFHILTIRLVKQYFLKSNLHLITFSFRLLRLLKTVLLKLQLKNNLNSNYKLANENNAVSTNYERLNRNALCLGGIVTGVGYITARKAGVEHTVWTVVGN